MPRRKPSPRRSMQRRRKPSPRRSMQRRGINTTYRASAGGSSEGIRPAKSQRRQTVGDFVHEICAEAKSKILQQSEGLDLVPDNGLERPVGNIERHPVTMHWTWLVEPSHVGLICDMFIIDEDGTKRQYQLAERVYADNFDMDIIDKVLKQVQDALSLSSVLLKYCT